MPAPSVPIPGHRSGGRSRALHGRIAPCASRCSSRAWPTRCSPQVGRATVTLLERLGHEVVFPPTQTCCGQMHVNTGYQREAVPLVRHHVEAFEPYDVVVAPSGSCVGSVRHQHAMVARGAGDEALAGRADGRRRPDVRAVRAAGRRARRRGRRRLRSRTGSPTTRPATRCGCCGSTTSRCGCCATCAGSTLVELPDADQCCGFGGTFALKNADTSTAMLADKMRHVVATGAEVATAGDCSCLMHIGGGLSRLRTGARDPAPRRDPGAPRAGAGERTVLGLRHRARSRRCTAARGVGRTCTAAQSFPDAARGALADTQLRRNLGHATTTIRAKRAAVVAEVRRLGGAAAGRARRSRPTTMARLDELLVRAGGEVTARGGTVHWARDAHEANAIVTRLVRATGATEVVKVKSMATQEIGLNEALAEAGIAAQRDRPRRADRAAGRRRRPPHPGAGDPPQPRGDPRDLPARDARRRPRADRRAAAPRRGRPAAPARARSCGRRSRSPAPTSPSPRPGRCSVVESEGNGRMCLTLPETLITVMGIEKVVPTWQDLEVFLQLLPRSSHGRADEPLHLDVDRRHPRRRAAGVPPGAARQRPHRGAGRRGRPRGAALHPLLGLPQRLPGLRARRRARLRLGLPGPDRRGAVAAAHRASSDNASLPYASSLCGACFDVCPVRIDIPSLLVHLRAQHVDADRARPSRRRRPSRWPRRPG